MRPVLEDTAVPRSDIWGGLEVDFAGAVVKGTFGTMAEKEKGGATLELDTLPSVDVAA